MSFRDNLQHLRATRNMTQEQLAMLLGVSRQTVTKWEAEKSNPEMDKLLQLCSLFDCTLDELVRGDLTSRPTDLATSVSGGPATDVCGYDDHMRAFARKIPLGIAAIILGVAVAFLFEGPASPLAGNGADVAFVACVLLGVAIGLAFIIPAGIEHSSFVKAHPYIEDFYTADEKAASRSIVARSLVGGIAAIFVGVIAMLLTAETAFESQGMAVLLACVAGGVWSIVHFGMMDGRTNVAEYNKNAADELEYEDIMSAQIRDDLKADLVAKKRRGQKTGAVCGAIMIVATIVALTLLFVPVFGAPSMDGFNPLGTSAAWFWVAWPVGGLLCGVVSLLMKAFGKDE